MVAEKAFERVSFNEIKIEKEFYRCVFTSCDFSNIIIQDVVFEECVFRQCNFSMVKFVNGFRQVKFIDCKLTGANFTVINKISGPFYFEKTCLNYANFTEVKMRNIGFVECEILEANFDAADIALSTFDRCNLSRTSFFRANLEKVDFSTSYNFSIDPTTAKLKKTVFSENNLIGLVSHLDIIIR